MAFKRAEITLSPVAQQSRETGVKMQMRMGVRAHRATCQIMVRGLQAHALPGVEPGKAFPVEVLYGEGDDEGMVRIRATGRGDVSNSLARPRALGNTKNPNPSDTIYHIPLGHQPWLPNRKMAAEACKWTRVEEGGEVWLEIEMPDTWRPGANLEPLPATSRSNVETSKNARQQRLRSLGELR